MAVSFDDPQNDEQSIMIFDAHTGELYAHEIVSMRERRVAVYTLFLRYGYAGRSGAAASPTAVRVGCRSGANTHPTSRAADRRGLGRAA